MKVVLLERIQKLGQMGDVVEVKTGFGVNYLLPQKKALRATKENLAYFDKQKAILEATNLKRKQDAEGLAKKIDNFTVTIIRQASEAGHLYGAVRNRDITDSLKESGFIVESTQVDLPAPIKVLGIHKVKINLHPEVSVNVGVNIAPSEEQAVAQQNNQESAQA